MKLKNFLREISNTKDISVLMDLGRQYYSSFSKVNCAQIFNLSIFYRKIDTERKDSLKLMTNTAFALFPFASSDSQKPLNVTDKKHEIQIFNDFCEKISKCYLDSQLVQEPVLEDNTFILKNFAANHLDYPEFTVLQYVKYLKVLDPISYKVYGFSLYDLSGLILSLFAQADFWDANDPTALKDCWISNERFCMYKEIFNVTELNLDSLFVDCETIVSQKPFPTDFKNIMQGKIGIKTNSGIFVPRSEFLFENLLHGLTDSQFANKQKGPLLETYILPIIKKFWSQANVYTNFYLGDQTHQKKSNDQYEQDFLIEDKNNIILIECKAQHLVEIRRNPETSVIPIKRNFDSVIGKACQQLEREKKYIQLNKADAIFTKTSRKSTFHLEKDVGTPTLYKIALTLDDYLGLAESSNSLTSKKQLNTWITNVFYLANSIINPNRN
ncbi:hypothetical protein [Lactiplantibacillus carotarum]|uniref:hypothetical protein n=1 Tax=Lactiplantibacillus carotarum TaxID=2993456 RepID=UPI00298EFDD8|nr:hypothetical protein [Lactiplantibacillus carotarum]